MKDIVITGKHLRRELFVLLSCFAAACLINLGAIIAYGRPAKELVTMIGYVVFVTLGLYLLLWLVRLAVAGICALVTALRKGKRPA